MRHLTQKDNPMHTIHSQSLSSARALRWESGSSLLSSKCCYLGNSRGRGVV